MALVVLGMIHVSRRSLSMRRWFWYPLEAAVATVAYAILAALPLDAASALGGWLARAVGPRLPVSGRAAANLRKAFPDIAAAEVRTIVRGMWENLGRVAAEFPHMGEIAVYDGGGRFEVVGAEHVDELRDDGRPGIFFTAHMGNWEFLALGISQRGVPLEVVYRSANNRLVEWLYRRGRAAIAGSLVPKGAAGARLLLRALKDGRHLGMLVDQKMNDGIAVPFFGRPVMTAPALAELALRFDCPVVPSRVERLKGARFRLTFQPPFVPARTGDRRADVAATMAEVNAIIERWVRERPEQWLWLHNRWPD